MRSIYVNNLKRWFEIFPRNQILIIKSEDFKSNKAEILKKTFEFLNISSYDLSDLKNKNVARYSSINSDTKKMLEDFFKPYNEKLYDLLNINFDW
ncbi:MAG: sulfotransferase domain-containing protein, partial [Nitrosopumilus sp.]|nr:sulfotransferase domain-containing protein [Nitrosopumilus sp.]